MIEDDTFPGGRRRGHSWHYMRFCGVCGARPAELLPVGVPRCRRHGGRPLKPGERLPRRPASGSAWRGPGGGRS